MDPCWILELFYDFIPWSIIDIVIDIDYLVRKPEKSERFYSNWKIQRKE